MSLPVFQATIVNTSGDIIPSPVITVLDEITGLPIDLFSDRNGTIPLGSGGVFTGGVDGFAQFFAAAGNYRVKAEQAASGFQRTWNFVALVGSTALTDTGTGSEQVPTNADLPTFGTMAEVNKQTSPTDTTAGRGLTTDTTHVSAGVLYTGANFQPEDSSGINARLLLRTTVIVGGGSTTAGANLNPCYFNSSGGLSVSAGSYAGTWRNVSGVGLAANEFGEFVRIA